MLKLIKLRDKRGITLIEVMVSLVFLSTGLIPLFGVILSSVKLSIRVKNNLVATNMAQEGIEVVRALRDKAWMDSAPYDRDLPSGDGLVSWDSDTIIPYDSSSYMKLDPATGVYSQTVGTDTIFKRRIDITKVPSPCNCEVKVTSEITWLENQNNRVLTVEDHLFDWKQ